MKNTQLMVTFLAAVTFLVGCDKEATTAQQIDKLQAKNQAAALDMQDYAFAQRAEFTAKMQLQLAELKTDLDQFEAKIEKSNDAVKAEAKPKIKALREQEAELNRQLEAVQNATESTWDSVKAGTKKAYTSLKEGFQQSRQWVSDKIAP